MWRCSVAETDREIAHHSSVRRAVDPVQLLVGLLTLGMATAAFVGDVPELDWFDLRWILAVGAVLIGALLLAGSLRGRRGS